MDRPPLSKRLAAEALGTFGFFFIGFVSIAAGAPGPIGFGFGLFLMITAFGHISGGHYNPAVTIGLTVGGKHSSSEVVQYIVAQLIGGVVAALVTIALFDGIDVALVNAPGDGISDGKVLILELIATALFLTVISAVATDSSAPWNGVMAPIFIGLFIFTAATVFGPLTGGSFNPARSLAPAITAGEFGDVWLYIVGPIVGGAVGGGLFRWIRQTP